MLLAAVGMAGARRWGGGVVLLAPHRALSVRTGACTEGRPAQGLSRGRSAPSAVSRSRARDKLAILVSYSLGRRSPNGRGLAPIGTLQHQICLVCPFLSRKAIFFCILGPVGTLYLWLRHSGLLLRSWSLLMP